MDRKVIVLTPSEWDKRISLGEGLDQAYQHLHYAITKEANLNAALHNLKFEVNKNASFEEIMVIIEDLINYASGISSEIRRGQAIIKNVSLVIEHKLKEQQQ